MSAAAFSFFVVWLVLVIFLGGAVATIQQMLHHRRQDTRRCSNCHIRFPIAILHRVARSWDATDDLLLCQRCRRGLLWYERRVLK